MIFARIPRHIVTIAFRQLFQRKRQAALIISGIGVAVMVLVTAMSLMNGILASFAEKIVNNSPHIVLSGEKVHQPVGDTLLYIEPIYIQASEAKMPQLKKIAVAIGNRLIYTDNYEEAVAELAGMRGVSKAAEAVPAGGTAASSGPSTPRTSVASHSIPPRLPHPRFPRDWDG